MAQYMIDNRSAPIDFECNSDKEMRTIQNCKNLLMTKQGEVPYDRFRGFNHHYFELPIDELNMRLVEELDRVMLWEPDAEVVSGKASMDSDGFIVITVVLEINL